MPFRSGGFLLKCLCTRTCRQPRFFTLRARSPPQIPCAPLFKAKEALGPGLASGQSPLCQGASQPGRFAACWQALTKNPARNLAAPAMCPTQGPFGLFHALFFQLPVHGADNALYRGNADITVCAHTKDNLPVMLQLDIGHGLRVRSR